MIQLPDSTKLTDLHSGQLVRASFIPLTPEIADREIMARWWSDPAIDPVAAACELDQHWPWHRIAAELDGSDFVECIALQTLEGRVQGACVYEVDGKSLLDPGAGAVHVALLASAPWNRERVTSQPLFRGVGSALLFRAVCHSYVLGLKGRIVLESLPTPETIVFYKAKGFSELGPDANGKLYKMELTSASAQQWLARKGMRL